MAHRVVIDCERRRVIDYTQDGIRVMFQEDKHDVLPQTVYDSRWHGLASKPYPGGRGEIELGFSSGSLQV